MNAPPSPPVQDHRPEFEYDRDQPLELNDISSRSEGDAIIRDITFRGPERGVIAAYLVAPRDRARGPGILMVHPGPGDRSFFLGEAIRAAGSGVTSLLVEMPWAQADSWGRAMGAPEHDRREFIGITRDLRRAVDVLTTRPEVDPSRLGFLGLSFGAMFGGLLAGADRRMTHYALLSGVGSFTDVAMLNLSGLQGKALDEYRAALSSLDPQRYISYAAPAHLLFVYGTQDPFPREKLEAYAAAGSEPKEVRAFEAGHYLNAEARGYALDWLLRGLSEGDRPGP